MFFDQRKPHFYVGTILKKKKSKQMKIQKIRKRKKSNFCLIFCVENSIIFHRKKTEMENFGSDFF